MISRVDHVSTERGEFVVKRHPDAPVGLFADEAEGIDALGAAGMRTPEVLAVGEDHLVLSWVDSGGAARDWVGLAHDLAAAHARTGDRFGWAHDNHAGTLVQENAWSTDGHAFFAEHRILRWLREPGCAGAFDAVELRGIERLAARLPALITPAAPVLLHGDLWSANVLTGPEGVGYLIDPAVYLGWPLADLAQLAAWGGIPDAFFDAYRELAPLPDDWRDQASVLAVRDDLGMLAEGSADRAHVERVRDTVARFG